MKITLSLLAFILLIPLAAACGGDDDDGTGGTSTGDPLHQALARMVLQIADVPEGVQSLGGSFSTNADAASGLGSGPTEAQLDAWGRILGHKTDFQATEPADESAITAISTSVSLYKTAQGTSDSFTDRVTSALAVDWANSHSDLTEFQQEELERDLGVDDMLWLHFTGYKEIAAGDRRLISDDQIVFRIDRAWGFLGVISTAAAGEEDRAFMLQPIEVLARTQAQHIRDGLKSDALE